MSERESQELAKAEIIETVHPVAAGLMDIAALQKVAKVYAASSFLPAAWRKLPEQERLANLIIMVNRASALKCDPLLLLQNLDIIAGRMCWKSTFLLQLLLAHGWTAARYELTGDPTAADFWDNPAHGCAFSAVNPATGEREAGTKITVAMVKGEGWITREGSKWRTMPEQMLKYRAVAFFARSNAPSVMGGFYSSDEVEDIVAQERRPAPAQLPPQPVAQPGPIELPADIVAHLNSLYEREIAEISSGKVYLTLSAQGDATDKLIARIDALRTEAAADADAFRAKYMAPQRKAPKRADDPLDPAGGGYHD